MPQLRSLNVFLRPLDRFFYPFVSSRCHAVEADWVLDVLELPDAQILEGEVEFSKDLLIDGLRDTDAARIRERLLTVLQCLTPSPYT